MNFNYLRYTYEPFHIWLWCPESFIAILVLIFRFEMRRTASIAKEKCTIYMNSVDLGEGKRKRQP